MIDIDIARQRD